MYHRYHTNLIDNMTYSPYVSSFCFFVFLYLTIILNITYYMLDTVIRSTHMSKMIHAYNIYFLYIKIAREDKNIRIQWANTHTYTRISKLYQKNLKCDNGRISYTEIVMLNNDVIDILCRRLISSLNRFLFFSIFIFYLLFWCSLTMWGKSHSSKYLFDLIFFFFVTRIYLKVIGAEIRRITVTIIE